ncbi:MAG: hypothetical protein U9O59_02710 [Actinomycetota bacterium]|nr:hypothetical protein [Actinomycetota bacterium]
MKKFITHFKKGKKGNITILVLIMGMVIIFTMAAMTEFMFNDVIFTEYYENRIKALNIAEAGISDMLIEIEEYYEDDNPLPSEGTPYDYDGYVADSGGNNVGRFYIDYEEVTDIDGRVTSYIITSTGEDLPSGQTRTVRVNMAVNFTTEVDMFSYIYSRETLEFLKLIQIQFISFINGPLYVGSDLNIRELITCGADVISSDDLLVGGNIDMGGSSELKSEIINVGGDIEMTGGASIESTSSAETMELIVMDDIRLEDNSDIGTSANPVNLSCHGEIITEGSSNLYYNEPIGDSMFSSPKPDIKVYVDDFINVIQEPPADVLVINEADMLEDGVFVIDPELLELPAIPIESVTSESVRIITDETNPTILVTKDADPGTAIVGDTITYDYTVTNMGIKTLYNITCDDSELGPVSLSGLSDSDSDGAIDDLPAGCSATGTLTYTVTESDEPGPINNTVTATGDTSSTPPGDDMEESVKVITNPHILVTKDASPNYADVGDLITYSYTVTNESKAMITDVTCVDSELGAVTLTGLTDEDLDGSADDLAAGATANGTAIYTVLSSDKPGPIENSVTATADSALVPDPVSDTTIESVKVIMDPHILVTKDAAPNVASVGETITYNYTATNVGMQTLYDVYLNDFPLGMVSLTGLTDEDGDGIADDLFVGQTATGSLTYEVAAGDSPGPIENKVVASGDTDPQSVLPEDQADDSVKIETGPYIVVEKDANPNTAEVGDTITYNYKITNISSEDVVDVVCEDSVLGEVTLSGLTNEDTDGIEDDLAAGATATGFLTYTVTSSDLPGPIENSVTVTCTPLITGIEFYRESGSNSIKFYEENGHYYIEIEGNVLVNGDIKIGESMELDKLDPNDNDIYYSGIGKLIATGDINVSSGLLPTGVFPDDDLLILMASDDLDITVDEYNHYSADYTDPDVHVLGLSGGTAILNSHNAVLGSLIANSLDARDESGLIGFLLGSLSTIGYDEGLDTVIPEDLPKLVYGGVGFEKQWEEVVD